HTLAQTAGIAAATTTTVRPAPFPTAAGKQHETASSPSTVGAAVATTQPPAAAAGATSHHSHPHHGQNLTVGSPSGSVVSISSVTSAGVAGAVSLRRHAEEVAMRLDAKLAALSVPGEGIGAECFV